MVSRFDGSDEVEALMFAGAWPATFKVAGAIEPDIQGAGKGELVGEGSLDEVAITRREGVEDVEYDFCSPRRAGAPPDNVPSS